MKTIAQKLAEVRARLEAVLGWRSDDFGHDTQKLLEAESHALQEIGGHAEQLADALEEAMAALENIEALAVNAEVIDAIDLSIEAQVRIETILAGGGK